MRRAIWSVGAALSLWGLLCGSLTLLHMSILSACVCCGRLAGRCMGRCSGSGALLRCPCVLCGRAICPFIDVFIYSIRQGLQRTRGGRKTIQLSTVG